MAALGKYIVGFVIASALATTSANGIAAAHGSSTPNSCIAANGGDWNACNVGNSGGGDLPYRQPTDSPDACIARNGGDWTACNVGNSGRGDLPYRPVP